MSAPTPHPRAVSTTDHAGPRVVGVSGDTLRRRFKADPASVPYVYQVGERYFVSTPKLHAAVHGTETLWSDCQGCWALGSDDNRDQASDEDAERERLADISHAEHERRAGR